MTQLLDDSVIVDCSGNNCTARLAMTRDELRAVNDRGGSVLCPGCERKKKEGTRKAAGRKQTAADLVLLAAADLAAAGHREFSEWDLAVAAWSLDRKRFGMRGYAESYPDHKRVYMEIAGNKPSSPVRRQLLVKVRPNTYQLTLLGRAAADRLRAREKN